MIAFATPPTANVATAAAPPVHALPVSAWASFGYAEGFARVAPDDLEAAAAVVAGVHRSRPEPRTVHGGPR